MPKIQKRMRIQTRNRHAKMKTIREKFLKIYEKLPPDEKRQIIIILKNQPYSWNVVYVEVFNKTKMSEVMLKKLHDMEII